MSTSIDSVTASTPVDIVVLELAHRPFGPDEVLLFYDGPQLLWLTSAHTRYLAMALPDGVGRWPFLLVALDLSAQLALETGSLTLRQAFSGPWPRWLLPDYDAEVLRAHRVDTVPVDWLPGDVPLC